MIHPNTGLTRAAHGKAPDIALPPDWERYVGNLSEFVKLKNGDISVDGAYGAPLTVTTVPPRSHPGKDDPGGHTEFYYLSEKTRNKVFHYPGFFKPVNTPEVPKYEVREAPGKGRGVFATCDIHPGDLIWAERPFIIYTTALIVMKGFQQGSHHTAGQLRALQFYATERILQTIIDRLTPERKAQFMSLANSHTEDGSGPCLGIIRTNQLGIRMVEGVSGPQSSEDPLQYTSVGYTVSLMNHSCLANIMHTFDFASCSVKVYSRAHIKKGDELVFSYVGNHAPAAQRQKSLASYGFRCKCRLCVADEATDTSWFSFSPRSYILANFIMSALLKEDFNNPFHKKSPAQQMAQMEDYNNKIKKLESLQRESDSWGHLAEPHLLCLLHELYKRVGNEKKRRRYSILVPRWKICVDLEDKPFL